MSLTTAQLPALNAAIKADPVLNALPNDPDANDFTAKEFNKPASPNFTVWKSNVPNADIATCFNGTELAGLTANNHTRLQTVAVWFVGGMNPALPDMRAMLDDIFSGTGGANTRSRLLSMYKRLATRCEKLYATGTGTDPSPAILVFEGQIGWQDVNSARNLG